MLVFHGTQQGTYRPGVRFQGRLATQAAQERFLEFNEWQDVLKKDPDPYIGDVPVSLLQTTGLKREAFLREMDTLARSLSTWEPEQALPPSRFPLSYAASGSYKHVFRVTLGEKHYALAVPHCKPEILRDGIKNFVLASHLEARDVARFICANAKAPWLLTEFIDENTDLSDRTGPSLSESGYRVFDDTPSAKNRVLGMLVDLDFMFDWFASLERPRRRRR